MSRPETCRKCPGSPQFNRCFSNVRQASLDKHRMLCRIHSLFRNKKAEQLLVQVALASPNVERLSAYEFGVSAFTYRRLLHHNPVTRSVAPSGIPTRTCLSWS